MIKKYVALAIAAAYGLEFLEAEKSAMEAMSSGHDAPESEILSMYEGVGIVEVKGKLTNTNSYYNKWYGLISYDTIRAACVEAVELGAGAILFDYDTPGGAVAGMEDISNFIGGLDIPTVSHTSSTMASAGLFLGISSDHVFSGRMSEVGSVGVVMQHMEVTEALKKQGVKVEVLRSGDKKAIGGPYEKLSAENKKYLQDQISTYADIFYSFVSEKRGIPLPAMGDIKDGGTFIGGEAVEAGLVDKIMSFDEALVFSLALAEKTLDNSQDTGNNVDYQRDSYILGETIAKGDTAMSKKISKAGLSAILTAGKSAPAATPDTNATQEPTTPDTQEPTSAEDVTPDADDGDGVVTDDVDDNVVEPSAELVALQEQFDASQVEIAELSTKLETVEAEHTATVEKLEATHAAGIAPLQAIIVAQINTMRTALSLTAVDMTTFAPDAVVKEYEAVLTTFESSFVVGGTVPNEEGKHPEEKTQMSREDAQNYKALNF